MSVYAVYNSKGGVGKTSSAVNLAWTAAHNGTKTLLWDLDPQGASSFALQRNDGLDNSVEKIFSGKKSWRHEVLSTAFANLHLIPADLTLRNWDILLDDEKKSKKVLLEWLKPLREEFPVIFLDCPPGLTLLSENLFRAADRLLIPVIPSPLSLRTFVQIKGHFAREGRDPSILTPFVSQVDFRKRIHREATEALLKLPESLKTSVPFLAEIERMGTTGTPSASLPRARSREIYGKLWEEILALS